MQPIKVHELAAPTCVLCPRILILFTSFNVAPSLCLCPCPTSISLSFQSFPKLISPPCSISISKLSYHCTISPPLSSISIKGVLLIDAKVCIWGRWLKLESCIIDGHHLIVGMIPLVDTTCMLYHLYLVGLLKMPHIGSLILISICGTPPPM